MHFPKLSPRAKILVALAGLMLENKGQYTFTQSEITAWIENKEPGFGEGKKRGISTKLREMREHNRVTVLDQKGNPVGEVDVLICTLNQPYVYRIGPDTVETPMSATLLKRLHDGRGFGVTTISAETELEIVDDIYEQFKNDAQYNLTGTQDIKNKIGDAINAFYFIRTSDGLLEPTRRLLFDDHDFIDYVAASPATPE